MHRYFGRASRQRFLRHCLTMPRSGLCREIKTKEARRLAPRGADRALTSRCGHSPEAESELLQECQQSVIGLKAFGSSFDGIGLGQGLFLHCKVGIQIDLDGFHRLMSEPKSNHSAIDAQWSCDSPLGGPSGAIRPLAVEEIEIASPATPAGGVIAGKQIGSSLCLHPLAFALERSPQRLTLRNV
jgi:hypothetical protein